MKKIGILFGQENTFPQAFVDRVNKIAPADIRAEFVLINQVEQHVPTDYAVIIDRISQDVPFYRAYLKNAALMGTAVINNPFWWSADEKFFNNALAVRLGVPVPKTLLLPSKERPADTSERSFRNLAMMDWDAAFEHIGFPAYMKPHSGGGWKSVYKVDNPAELFKAYDETGELCMTLQTAVNFKEYFRCYVVGQSKVHIMQYDPRLPQADRYVRKPTPVDPALLARVEADALKLCRALGYDLNTVEFAVEEGIPYAIDFLNPAPDADYHSVGPDNFEWIVEAVADLAIEKALSGEVVTEDYRWGKYLNGE